MRKKPSQKPCLVAYGLGQGADRVPGPSQQHGGLSQLTIEGMTIFRHRDSNPGRSGEGRVS